MRVILVHRAKVRVDGRELKLAGGVHGARCKPELGVLPAIGLANEDRCGTGDRNERGSGDNVDGRHAVDVRPAKRVEIARTHAGMRFVF